MNDARIYAASAQYLHTAVGYSEMRKRSSVFMWTLYVVSFMWIWNRRFMDAFHTTIFGRIYWADDGPEGGRWRTLWHECVHRRQAIRRGEPWFSLTYLFPQSMALFALGAVATVVTPGALVCLSALAFLGPWPAPWRVTYEREAYLITAVCDALRGWDIEGAWYLDYQVENHCGWAYYKPAWRRSKMRKAIALDIARARRLVTGADRDPLVDELLKIVRDNK